MAAAAHAATWVPPRDLSWYWQLTGTVDNSYGAAAYDIDGFDNTAAEVATLHAAGKHVICYIDVGTWEDWRSDASEFPSSVLGNGNGWPGEKWLDIRQLSVLEPIMTARFEMCKQKGFDAVEPDNMDGYENSTGFPLTAQDQLNYNEWVAEEAHSLGLAVFQKNDPDQASTLEPYFDGALDEQCNQYSECSSFAPYLSAGKPVLNAEYSLSASQFCASDNPAGMMGALYSVNLDGSLYEPCWSGDPGFTPLGSGSSSSSGQSAPSAGAGGTARSMRVDVGSVTDRQQTVAVTVSCPGARSYCYGSVRLSMLRTARRSVVLGTRRFRIRARERHAVRIALTDRAAARLVQVRSVRVLVNVVAYDSTGRRGVTSRTRRLRFGH
ncbi:MAG TPA: endo alpha-1,4 polygalactosaminidase [Solirubrobacteraceae bacterium]|nr:endo alpha-1,4 polygalactosaminidase [Solirubrobacteraceae bacterium]